jgi:GGDEF domain-containing protein
VQVVLCKRTIRSAGESGPLEMLGWLIQRFAKPRIVAWRRRHAEKKRDQFFVTSNDVKLRQFVRRFSEFISAQNSHSLISMIRSGFSLNMPVEQIITGDYINNWFQSYCEQLAFPVTTRKQFVRRSIDALPPFGGKVKVTASLGVAVSDEKRLSTADALARAADEAMYVSKFTTKNRLCIWPPDKQDAAQAEVNRKKAEGGARA